MQLLCLIPIANIACMKFHPGCEWCAASLLDFHCWHCLHEILSKGSEPCAAPLLDFHCWHCLHGFHLVSESCAGPYLISTADIVCINSHLESESCAASLLDFDCWHCSAWNPIQEVSCVQLLYLIHIADVACLKFHPVCESCAAPLLDFHCW